MPDGTGGIATGLYWVATGRLPLEDLKEQPKPATAEDKEKKR